jgi:DNA-binding protein YbaB
VLAAAIACASSGVDRTGGGEMDLHALRAQADELMAQFERMRAGAGDLQQKLRTLSASVTSKDGLVTATVGPRGQLIRLELDPRIYRRPNSRELAATITETVQRATTKAMDQVEELCRPFIPDAQFQAHMNFDFEGIFRQLDSDLPGGDD